MSFSFIREADSFHNHSPPNAASSSVNVMPPRFCCGVINFHCSNNCTTLRNNPDKSAAFDLNALHEEQRLKTCA